MKTGRVEYAPDYQSQRRRARAIRSQDWVQCEWCGRGAEIGTLRQVEVLGKRFKVCSSCPPPDNANAMHV